MKILIYWFCYVLLENSVKIMCQTSFFSCNFFHSLFHVTFDCAFLDNKVLHKNYFDERLIDDTCDFSQFMYETTFSSADSIALKNCRMPILPQEFLQRIKHVKVINLDTSGVKVIDKQSFPNGCSLETLSLSGNDLTELPPILFSQTPNISNINLSRNRIRSIDADTFHGTTRTLKVINLSFNNIETIDKQLFADLVNLQTLKLGNNFIEHFQVNLSKLEDLSVLGLDNNKITRLDCTIFRLATNKITIDVHNNHVQEMDLNCDVHIESVVINVMDNQLTHLTFPKSNLLNGLTELYASKNHIENVTFQSSIRQLTALHLNVNNLKELVEWDETMFPKLRFLDISSNRFNCSYLSALLKKLPKTVELELKNMSGHPPGDERKASKAIHGINCVDGVQTAFQSDEVNDAEQTAMWCVLALLSLAVLASLSVKMFKFYRRYQRSRFSEADNLSMYHKNGPNL